MLDSTPFAAPTIEQLLPAGAPNWDAIDFDVLCGRCGYNLRTLSKPLCPECGLGFDWREAINRGQWRGRFLLEYDWSQAPVKAWVRTVWRTMWPRRYWKSVSIHAPIRPVPLCVLYISSIITLLVPLFLDFYYVVRFDIRLRELGILWVLGILVPSLRSMISHALLVALPLLVLCVFQDTLARCRIRRLHLLRITANIAIPITAAKYITDVISMMASLLIHDHFGARQLLHIWCMLRGPLLIYFLFLSWHLRAALKHYLRIPHAGLAAVATALLTCMAYEAVMIILP